MVQLQILSGRMAGTQIVARRFPFRVGRSGRSDVRLEEPGVWEDHFAVEFKPPGGFTLNTDPQAFATISGRQVQSTVLKPGDLIEIGSVKLRFSLSPAPQKSLVPREMLTWTGLALIALAQVALIYWLIQ